MTPISIDNQAKSACLNQFIDGKNLEPFLLQPSNNFFLKGRNWKYNSRYWTSGLRSSPSQFQWCNNSATVDPALWLDKQPDNVNNTENCAQLFISKTKSTARLSDKHCGVVNAFACQASSYCGLYNFKFFDTYPKKIFLCQNLAKHFAIFDPETKFHYLFCSITF
jgi:Lectin C-type domain